jgi:hypothetical protein
LVLQILARQRAHPERLFAHTAPRWDQFFHIYLFSAAATDPNQQEICVSTRAPSAIRNLVIHGMISEATGTGSE